MMNNLVKVVVIFLLLGLALAAKASDLHVHKVTETIYALVGELGQRSAENLANNATFGVILTDKGVVLIDPGGSRQGAQQIENSIKAITDKPVILVINSGGQDHRWLGNGYFREKGARILASTAAVADQKARQNSQLLALEDLIGADRLAGTEPVYAEETFEDQLTLQVGGVEIQLFHHGTAHTPGDILIWLPQQRVVFTGDIVYVERMLGVGAMSHSGTWIDILEKMIALRPTHLIPGHGVPTDLTTAQKDTLDYLRMLRREVGKMLDDGRGMDDVGMIDQSDFSYLDNYDQLKGRNAQQVYAEMEFE